MSGREKWLILGLVFVIGFAGKLGAEEKKAGEKNLAAYWSFDEPEGNVAKDYSGQGNDGKIIGATRVKGISGNALSFGDKSSVDCGKGKNLVFSGDYSLEVWVKHESGTDQGYVTKWTAAGGNSAWWLGFLEGVVQCGDYYEGGQSRIKGDPINDNEWHHVVGVREGTSIYLYIDGERIAEGQSLAMVAGDNPAPVYIGAIRDAGSWLFKGTMDEVRIYSRALREEEIKERYDLIKSGKKK